jgi:hypothetical protein
MKSARLAAADFALAKFPIDALVLVAEARIHLGASRVVLIPCSGVRKLGRARNNTEREDNDGHARTIGDGEHWLLPFGKWMLIRPMGTMPMRCLSSAERLIHEPDKSMAQKWRLRHAPRSCSFSASRCPRQIDGQLGIHLRECLIDDPHVRTVMQIE